MKKVISVILLLVLVFYYLYPTGLPVFGYSFLLLLGSVGLALYVFHQYPFKEVIPILLCYGLMFIWSYFSTFVNHASDSFIIDYTKSQIAWFFAAYLLINIFYKVHPKGTIHMVMYYVIGAVFIQCVISVAMYMSPEANTFFSSLAKMGDLEAGRRMQTEGVRLLGYGIAFFGAGASCGFVLILIGYVFMSRKMNGLQIFLHALAYCFIFYIGLFSARTTLVGLVASIVLMIVLSFIRGSYGKQLILYVLFSLILFSVGYTLCYIYFKEFAEWAFEVFLTYEETGEIGTSSSNGLSAMFIYPSSAWGWIFGVGIGGFIGTDVGFSRLFFWFGLPGTILYFYYQILIIKQAFTKNRMLDLTLIVIFVYCLALNYKGLSDLNPYCLLFAFYFMYYKYYIYTPYLYRIGKINQTSLRHAVQTKTARRRIQSNV